MKLRDYQEHCIEKVSQELIKTSTALVVAATGSGKTVVFVKFVERCAHSMANKNRSFHAMILVHKIDLVEQSKNKFNIFAQELQTGLYCGSLNKKEIGEDVTIASIDSIKNQFPFVNLLIVDEYHRFYYRKAYFDFKKKLEEINPRMKTVCFTATPYGKTGFIYGNKGDEIEAPCFQIGMNKLIEMKHLVPVVFKSSKESFDVSSLKEVNGDFSDKSLRELSKDENKSRFQVASSLAMLEGRNKVIWCCTCIEHAEIIEGILLDNGERAVAVHSKIPVKRQFEFVDHFEHGPLRHLVSVTKLSEGTDIPCVDAIVCLRPTRSPTLYVQMVGRGLRPFEGKKDCLFLDFGGVVEALGHPSDPYIKPRVTRRDKKPRAIVCPACRELNFYPVNECSCGYEFLKDEREVDRLANLGLIPYDPTRKKKIAVLNWSIHWHYVSKRGMPMVLVNYATVKGTKRQYIPKFNGNKYYKQFIEDHKKGVPPFIVMDNNNKFVKERVYA